MSFQPGANLYGVAIGSRPENVEVPHIDVRAPSIHDILYPIGKRWIDQVAQTEYVLMAISSVTGVSEAQWALLGGTSGALNTLTTDDLTVVTPVAGNINLSGTGSTTTVGAGDTATVELTGLTNHNVLVGAGTATITKVAPSATVGIPLVSAGAAADPIFSTATVPGGGTGAVTLTGLLIGNGTSPITGNPITNHDVLVGGASNAVTSVAPSATVGVPLVSAGAAADPAFGTAVVAGGGTGATTLTAHGVLLGEGTSAVVATTAGTNGQVLLGSTGADPAFGTLTSTTGVTFTGGAASLAINISGGGFSANSVAGTTQALSVQNSYIANNAGATVFTLPATAAVGSMILICGGTGNSAGWAIAQNAGQTIHKGDGTSSTTGVTGTATSVANADASMLLMCVTANTDFTILYSNATITLA